MNSLAENFTPDTSYRPELPHWLQRGEAAFQFEQAATKQQLSATLGRPIEDFEPPVKRHAD